MVSSARDAMTFAERLERTEQLIVSEGEKTRRHFDAFAARMMADGDLLLDLELANAERIKTIDRRLSDHELRLGKLERRANSE